MSDRAPEQKWPLTQSRTNPTNPPVGLAGIDKQAARSSNWRWQIPGLSTPRSAPPQAMLDRHPSPSVPFPLLSSSAPLLTPACGRGKCINFAKLTNWSQQVRDPSRLITDCSQARPAHGDPTKLSRTVKALPLPRPAPRGIGAPPLVRALSSVGRALPLHGRCRRFEPVSAHHGFPPSS